MDATVTSAPSHLYLVSPGCQFTALKTIVLNVRCALPTFGIGTHDCAARHRDYLTGMSLPALGPHSVAGNAITLVLTL
jgi:hypothetical protein